MARRSSASVMAPTRTWLSSNSRRELRVHGERAEVVGPDDRHHDGRDVGVGDGVDERPGEARPLLLVPAQRDDLLELVDHHDDACPAAPAQRCVEHCSQLVGLAVEAPRQLRGRDADQGCERLGERPQRVLARSTRARGPGTTARQRVPRQCGEEAGAHERRLAAARGTDDADEAVDGDARHERGHQALAPVEERRVGGFVARQPLVRAHPGRDTLRCEQRRGARARAPRWRSASRNARASCVDVPTRSRCALHPLLGLAVAKPAGDIVDLAGIAVRLRRGWRCSGRA